MGEIKCKDAVELLAKIHETQIEIREILLDIKDVFECIEVIEEQ